MLWVHQPKIMVHSVMISLADKIEHIGDTNNTIEFGTDEIKLRTGGGSRLIARDSNVELYNDLVVKVDHSMKK